MSRTAVLRAIKNQAIGSKTAKLKASTDGSFVVYAPSFKRSILGCLNPERDASSVQPTLEETTEAANVLYTLCSGPPEGLAALLRSGAAPAIIHTITFAQASESRSLKIAVARAFRALFKAAADWAGPSLWGLAPAITIDIRSEAQKAIDGLFQGAVLDKWIPMLKDEQFRSFISLTIAEVVRVPRQRALLVDWTLPEERLREPKARRGWEKPDLSKAVNTSHGYWILRQLASDVDEKRPVNCAASLMAIATLAKDNPAVATFLKAESSTGHSTYNQAFSCLRSRSSPIRVAAALCATYILKSTTHGSILHDHAQQTLTIIHCLDQLISSKEDALANRSHACYILSYIIGDDLSVARAAIDSGALTTIVRQLSDNETVARPDYSEADEDDESVEVLEFREALFIALGALAKLDPDARRTILETTIVLPSVSRSILHPHPGLRYSSVLLVRFLARSVAALRTSLGDSQIPTRLVQLVTRPDEQRSIIIVALMALANTVNFFAPLRDRLYRTDLLSHITKLARSTDDEIRLGAVWIISNTLSEANLLEKKAVMEILTFSHFVDLCHDNDMKVRARAFSILQNLTTKSSELSYALDSLGEARTLQLLHESMSSPDPDCVLHGIRTLNHLLVGTDATRQLVTSHKPLLNHLRVAMTHANMDIRQSSVVCVCEMLMRVPNRYKDLRDAGIEQALRQIVGGRGRAPSFSGGSGLGSALSSMTHGHTNAGANPVSPTSATSSHPFSPSTESPGVMGREGDRVVLESAKLALGLFDRSREWST